MTKHVRPSRALQLGAGAGSPFERAAYIKCFELASADNTRRAYWNDFRVWTTFCADKGLDPAAPRMGSVVAWVEWMKDRGDSSKTRARRMCALSSLYRRLRKSDPPLVTGNPFSVEDGPDREKAQVIEPTPIAAVESVRKILATCDETPLGMRDAAIIRVLWGTGMRRISLLSMTMERISRDGPKAYVATVIAKRGKSQRVLVRGEAFTALERWLGVLREAKLVKGPVWRNRTATMLNERAIQRMLDKRAELAGVTQRVSPHMFRVAFLTHNPAGLEAKQDAAGHSDPATTRLYDRTDWKGREAFVQMPEIEEIEDV